jgi:hypothetical protein
VNEHVQALVGGIAIAGVLALDGLLHAYWATGQTWPTRNKLSLVQAVLNSSNTRAFRPAILLPLAALLVCGALMVLARIHGLGPLGQLAPAPLLQLGLLVLATGFLLRGLLGIVWVLGLLSSKSELFYKINLLVYTPVCLILFVATVVVASS